MRLFSSRDRMKSTSPDQSDCSETLTIDELSAKTGVPSRTIRFYQAKGALPPPEKKGRVAYYCDRHIERLKLVAQLQERGISLRAIRDLVEKLGDGDVSVNEWLGFDDRLQASWIEDEPKVLSEEQLRELIGSAWRPGLLVELERAEYIRRDGSKRPPVFIVPSMAQLQIVLKLEAGGVDVQTSRAASELMRNALAKLAYKLVQHFHSFLVEGLDSKRLDPEQLGRSIDTLRTIWMEATSIILAREIERAIRERVEKGDLLMPSRRR
jgi:DNA-binding transcriptional MerR regulator